MKASLKQFVPSEVCLKCDGCCRFKDAESSWRPKISADEIAQAKRLGLAQKIFSQNVVDNNSYIRTSPGCGEHFCSFFNPQDHSCAIYQARPFECELYPFIISRNASGATAVYVHLNCPHVEHNYRSPVMNAYVEYLKEFMNREGMLLYLQRNRALLNDYSPYQDELEFLFALEV